MAFAIAYRMLGSVAEAEDVVQDALLRVHRALEEGERIARPRAYAGRSPRGSRSTSCGRRAPAARLRRRLASRALIADETRTPGAQAEMADSLRSRSSSCSSACRRSSAPR